MKLQMFHVGEAATHGSFVRGGFVAGCAGTRVRYPSLRISGATYSSAADASSEALQRECRWTSDAH